MAVQLKPSPATLAELRERLRRLAPGEELALERPLAVEQFCELADEEINAELVNGVIQKSPPPSDAHEDVAGWLYRVLGDYVEARKLGKTRGSRSGIRIASTSLREAYLRFFGNAHPDRLDPSGVHGAPDFVVEVVDSDAVRRQAVQKQAQYELIGVPDVPELWVVDLPWKELRHFALEEGHYCRSIRRARWRRARSPACVCASPGCSRGRTSPSLRTW